MRSMIIGANSFIGMHLFRYLKKQPNQEVIPLSVELPNDPVDDWDGAATEMKTADLTSIESVSALLEEQKPDCIYSLLAVDSISYGWEHPKTMIQVHVTYMLNVLGAVKEYNPDIPMLILGSGEEYGHVGFDNLPISETQTPRPMNVYAATKACQNMMARLYCEAYKMHIVTARIFNAIGPWQQRRFVAADFCAQAVAIERGETENKILVGNLNIRRDFIDIRDVVEVMVLLCERGEAGQVYNVGSGNAVAIREVLEEVLCQTNIKPVIERRSDKMRPIDVPVLEADMSKCYEVTGGWTPKYTLSDTIRDMLAAARKNR